MAAMADTMGIGIVLGFMTQGMGSLVAAHHQLKALEMQLQSTDSRMKNFAIGIGQIVVGLVAMKVAVMGLKSAMGDLELAGAVQTDLAYTGWIMGLSAEETQAFREQAVELASTYPVSIDVVSESMQKLARAGWDVNETLAMMPVIAQAAVLGDMSMADATELLIAPIRALNLEGQDAALVLDQLTMAANIFSGIELPDFRRAFGTFGGDMGAFNQSLADTVTLFGTFTSRGMSAERAATMVKMVLQRVYAPSPGSLSLFRQLGVETTDAEGNFRSIIDVLEDLENALAIHPDIDLASSFDLSDLGEQSQQEAQIIQSLFGARSSAGFRIASQAGQMINGEWVEGFESLRENADRINNSIGTSAEGMDIIAQNYEYQMGVLKSSWGAFREELGNNVLPALSELLTVLTNIVHTMTQFQSAHPNLAKAFQALTVIISAILFLAGALLALKGLVTVLTLAWGVLKGVLVVTSAILGGVSLATLGWIALIIAAIAAIVIWRRQIWDFLKSVGRGAVNIFETMNGLHTRLLALIYSTISSILSWLVNLHVQAASFLAGLWNTVKNSVSDLASSIWGSISGFFSSIYNAAIQLITSIIQAMWQYSSPAALAWSWAGSRLGFGTSEESSTAPVSASFARGAYRFTKEQVVTVHRDEELVQADRDRYSESRGPSSTRPSSGGGGVTIGTVNLTVTPTGSTQVDANRLFEQFLDKIEHNQARVMQAVGLPVKNR